MVNKATFVNQVKWLSLLRSIAPHALTEVKALHCGYALLIILIRFRIVCSFHTNSAYYS